MKNRADFFLSFAIEIILRIFFHSLIFAEGLAVGVSFGAIGSTSKATFEAARNLAIGIGEKLN